MAGDNDQRAIVEELYSRRDSLSPEQGAIVDELASRFGIKRQAASLGSEGNAELARFGLSAEPPKAPKPAVPDKLPATTRFAGGVGRVLPRNLGEAVQGFGSMALEANKLLHPATAAMTGQTPEPSKIVKPAIDTAKDMYSTAASGDVATTAGMAAGIAAPLIAARGVPPIVRGAGRAVATAADRMGVPAALERSALNSYRRMLNPSAKGVVPEAERVAEGLVKDRPVAMTRGGMIEQMQSKKAEVGPAAGTIYDNRPPVDPTPILQQLDGMRQHSSVAGGITVDQGLSDAITGIADNIRAMRDSNGMVPAKALDQYRDLLFKGNVSATNHMRATAPASAASLEKSAANVIRTRLDELFPDAKPINDAYHTAASTENFLREATNAEKAAESGIRTGAASGFGAAVKKVIPAPLRGVPTAAASIFESTGWDSSMGAGKAILADSIRKAAWKRPLNPLTDPSRLLPPGSAPFTQGTSVPDFRGQWTSAVNREMAGPRLLPQGRAPFTQGIVVPDILGRPNTGIHLLEAPMGPQVPTSGKTFVVGPAGASEGQVSAGMPDAYAPYRPGGVGMAGGDRGAGLRTGPPAAPGLHGGYGVEVPDTSGIVRGYRPFIQPPPQADPGVVPPSSVGRVIDMTTRTSKHGNAAGPEWWAEQPPTRPEIQARYDQLFNRAENLSPQRPVEVPHTGISEGVLRGMDARHNIAAQVLGKPLSQATPTELRIIDELIAEGYGSAPPRPSSPGRAIASTPTNEP